MVFIGSASALKHSISFCRSEHLFVDTVCSDTILYSYKGSHGLFCDALIPTLENVDSLQSSRDA